MARHFVNQRELDKASTPVDPLWEAATFFAVASAIFVSSLMLRVNPALLAEAPFDWGRRLAVMGGWATPFVSQSLPPGQSSRRVADLSRPQNRPKILVEDTVALSSPPATLPATLKSLPKIPSIAPKVALVKPALQDAPIIREAPNVQKVAPESSAPTPSVPVARPAKPVVEQKIAKITPQITPEVTPALRPRVAPIDSLRVSVPKKQPETQIASINPKKLDPKRVETDQRVSKLLMPKPQVSKPHVSKPSVSKPSVSTSPRTTPTITVPEEQKIARLLKDAKAGLPEAQLELAQHFHTQNENAVALGKAVFWYHHAARQGVVEAQFNLGLIYYLGEGTPKNIVQAYRWIELAARQNDHRAQAVLKALHRSLPAPVFTSLVFPEPIVLEATPMNAPVNAPIRQAALSRRLASQRLASQRFAGRKPAVVIRSSPASRWPGMAKAAYWKPQIFLLGNKPLP